MNCPKAMPSVSRRRIYSEANLSEFSHLERKDCELLLQEWQLERRQLQIENQRLAKSLDDAQKHIHILRKKKKKKSNDDGVVSVSSSAITAKAGSSHKLAAACGEITSLRKRLIFPRLFCLQVERKETAEVRAPVTSTAPVTTAFTSHDDAPIPVRKVPPTKLKRSRSIVKASRSSMRPNHSFDSTEASSRDPSLAEF